MSDAALWIDLASLGQLALQVVQDCISSVKTQPRLRQGLTARTDQPQADDDP